MHVHSTDSKEREREREKNDEMVRAALKSNRKESLIARVAGLLRKE